MEVHKGVDGVVIPYVFAIPDCPPMCLDLSFVEFVSSSGCTLFPSPLFSFFLFLVSFAPFDLVFLISPAFFLSAARQPCSPIEEHGEGGGSRVGGAATEGKERQGGVETAEGQELDA